MTRAFRAEILNGEGGACGVLCPLLDLRNHADGAAEATPRASDDTCGFVLRELMWAPRS